MDANLDLMVLGTSRGGTTLLAAALGAHPCVAMLDEDFCGAYKKIVGGKKVGLKLCTPNQIDINKRWHPIFGLGRINGFLRKTLFMNKVPLSDRNIRDYAKNNKIVFFCILRHPAGVIKSIMARENKSEAVALYRWCRTIDAFSEMSADGSIRQVLVSFENLVQSPEPTLRGVCDNLCLDFSCDMLSAPFQNSRYKQSSFDLSKVEYSDSDLIWKKIPSRYRSLYRELREATISAGH